jgi:lipopolysaccharide transport system ATP-binding protein
MSLISVRAENIGKCYMIGANQRNFDRLGDQVLDAFVAPFRRAGKLLRGQATGAAELDEEMWALDEVSFDIHEGEVVGIVGANGAGKSTLLKIMSRITEPTTGFIDVYGRVGSLLEVGTGFHQELTGRENVFLNGSILGMGRKEVALKFDEIVDFSDIEQFIDTPVKHYSSGMYVRLAFAVAAHLLTDVLLVDEVLAVGDLEFQKKCLGKMDDVAANDGRTVLFVSHNMGLILALCKRGLLLHGGKLVSDGPIDSVVSDYLDRLDVNEQVDLSTRTDRRGEGHVRLTAIESLNLREDNASLRTGDPTRLVFHTDGLMRGLACNVLLHDFLGRPIANFKSAASSPADSHDPNMGHKFELEFDELQLMPGRYRVDVVIRGRGGVQDMVEGAAFIDVSPGMIAGRALRAGQSTISVALPHRWRLPVKAGD